MEELEGMMYALAMLIFSRCRCPDVHVCAGNQSTHAVESRTIHVSLPACELCHSGDLHSIEYCACNGILLNTQRRPLPWPARQLERIT